MKNIKVKVKKLAENAVIPSYANPGDAGLDLTATSMDLDKQGNIIFGTGIAMEIPEGYVGLIFPINNVSKYDHILTNCVGVIDSGYRGEITFKFKPIGRFNVMEFEPQSYEVGDRVGQIIIMPIPYVTLVESEELSESERGTGSYGSTGK